MSVIAHVDHGKSTLTRSLVSKAKIIAVQKDERERCTTIESTAETMYFCCYIKVKTQLESKTNEKDEKIAVTSFFYQLIDPPGCVDLRSEITAALYVTNGALVVIDSYRGLDKQTIAILHQAISGRIKPVLFINKLDRTLLEAEEQPEALFKSFQHIVQNVDDIIGMYNKEISMMGEIMNLASNLQTGATQLLATPLHQQLH